MTVSLNGGLIHDEIDLKLLILYVLRRLPAPVDRENLFEVCICDNGVEYFDFAEYLQELTENENIVATEDDEYVITEKGRRNGEEVENSLPKSVRIAADKAIAPLAEHLNRMNCIHADPVETENGTVVHLSVSDGAVDLLDMRVFCGDMERAKKIRKIFRKNAEGIYSTIIDLLTEEKRRKK